MDDQDGFVRLSNGVRVPLLGLGTSHNGGYSHEAVVYALRKCGYRLIDTAERYGCEELLGQAVKDSGVPRADVFITTKVWPTSYGYQPAIDSCRRSMKKFDVDYLDMYLLHWPLCHSNVKNVRQTLEDTWRALENLYDEGMVRSIGVSNYDIDDLQEMLDVCSIKPQLNQIEFHPYQRQTKIRQFCDENNIQIEGYSPLAKGKILSKAPVIDVSKEYNKTPAQVLIKWSIQNGVITIPKSTNLDRIRENSQASLFKISKDSMQALNDIDEVLSAGSYDKASAQMNINRNLPHGYRLYIKPV